MTEPINAAGVNLIKSFESLMDGDPTTPGLDPYICPSGYATLGYGHVVTDKGKMLSGKAGLKRARQMYPRGISKIEAENLLATDLLIYAHAVDSAINRPMTKNQRSAMVSLCFNIGQGAFAGSSVVRLFNQGNLSGAAQAFGMWTKATVDGKKVTLNGLVRRRAAETALFLTPDVVVPKTSEQVAAKALEAPMLIASENKLSESPTMIGGSTAVAGTVVSTGLSEVINGISEAQTQAQMMMPYLEGLRWLVILLTLAGAAVTIWSRYDSWKKGKR